MKKLKKTGVVFLLWLISVPLTAILDCSSFAVPDVIVPSTNKSGLPAPGTPGRLRHLTDDVRGIWMDQGALWFATNGEIVNVKEFGAKGDNTTDDTSAIQSAINALGSQGKVYFPRGSYKITSTIVIGTTTSGNINSISVEGEISIGTQLIYTGSTATPAVKIISNARFEFSNIRILNGNTAGSGIGLLVTSNITSGSNCGPGVFRNVVVNNFNDGIQIGEATGNSASEITWINLEVDGNTTGVHFKAGADNSQSHLFLNLVGESNGTVLLAETQDNIWVVGGSVSGSTVADFRLNTTGVFGIQNFRTESATRFLLTGPATGGGAGSLLNMTIFNCRIASTLASDGFAIQLHQLGHYLISGNYISGAIEIGGGEGSMSSVHLYGNDIISGLSKPYGPVTGRNVIVRSYGNSNITGAGTGTMFPDEYFLFTNNGRIELGYTDYSSILSPFQQLGNLASISSTSTLGKNLRGSATFTTTGATAVNFANAEPDTSFYIATSCSANETFWVTGKATTGFTINSNNPISTAICDWILIR